MRLLIKLKSQKDYAYDVKYYHKLQGFIYTLLKDSEYSSLHDKISYKFFSFSNIFPISNNKFGSVKNLLIASPNKKFILALKRILEETKEKEELCNIGEMSFKIEDLSLVNPKIRKNCNLVTATPIIIRIPSYNFDAYGIDSNKKYVYWRKEYSFDAFVKQLNDNLIKKYNEFHNSNIENIFLFEHFAFKKTVVNHVVIKGKEYKFIGSMWEFNFPYLTEKQKNILELGIDTGFGERNSLGFGFVNIVN